MGTHSPEKWNIQLWLDSDVLAEKIKIGKIPALVIRRKEEAATGSTRKHRGQTEI